MGGLMSGKCTSKARLDGKTVIITGANTGIGKITASFLCRRGAHVVLTTRDKWKGEEAIAEIEDELYGIKDVGTMSLVVLDLASFASVRRAASFILSSFSQIHILINNAGVMMVPRTLSLDGYELQFATNHLGHFLFTLLLLPRIIDSAPAKIINVASIAHTFCRSMRFSDINLEKSYNAMGAYFRSKAANVLFTKELVRKFEERGVKDINVYALHPGVVDTALWQYTDTAVIPGAACFMANVAPIFIKSPWLGAQTTIHCAICEKAADQTGLYYSDCRPKTPTAFVRDPEVARKLFDISLKMVKYDMTQRDPFVGEKKFNSRKHHEMRSSKLTLAEIRD